MPAFRGPIGTPQGLGDCGLVDYALARTFRITNANRNQNAANCKGCGKRLVAGDGFEVQVATTGLGRHWRQFLCRICFKPVKAAAEVFPLFDPLPGWWEILRRESKPGQSQQKSMSEEQIDKLIRSREKK